MASFMLAGISRTDYMAMTAEEMAAVIRATEHAERAQGKG